MKGEKKGYYNLGPAILVITDNKF